MSTDKLPRVFALAVYVAFAFLVTILTVRFDYLEVLILFLVVDMYLNRD